MSRYVIRNNVHYGTVDEMVNTIEAQAAEIERLAKDKRWIIDERDRTFALMLSRAEDAEAEIERLRGERDELEAMAMRAATIAQEQRARAEKNIKRAEILVEAWYRCDDASFRHLMEAMRADVAEAKAAKP